MTAINPILKDCIAKVAPEVRDEVRRNMESIEERATIAAIKDTSKGRNRADYFISAMADHENGFREGYIQGATEQKAIDIDKACKWLMEHISGDVECNEDGEPFAESFIEERKLAMQIVNDFRKAMAKKIKAVLNGADVIETPTDKEIDDAMKESITETILCVAPYGGFTPRATDLLECAWVKGAEWLKSKIVK